MLERFRQFWSNVWAPVGDLLLRLGVKPDWVTWVGELPRTPPARPPAPTCGAAAAISAVQASHPARWASTPAILIAGKSPPAKSTTSCSSRQARG